jgi:hypothetical protein
MMLANGVLRHSLVLSCLAATAACGGFGSSQKAASPTSQPGGSYYSGNSGGGAVATADYSSSSSSSSSGTAAYDSPHASTNPIAEAAPERPGLGTTFGEQVYAPVSFAPFTRAGAPWAEVALHYNDADGIEAHARYLGTRPQPLELFAGDGSLSVALTDDYGRTLPGLTAQGRTMIVGEDGQRYKIVVRNATTARFEIVASVDGLDVIDGKQADPNRRGYIVDPHDTLVIDGFRTSDANVAAFRFGRVADSYAAQTSGDRNVGVVGLAIFAERGAVWTTGELNMRDTANPFPSRGYAMPPR